MTPEEREAWEAVAQETLATILMHGDAEWEIAQRIFEAVQAERMACADIAAHLGDVSIVAAIQARGAKA